MDTEDKMRLLLDERANDAYQWICGYAANLSNDKYTVTAEELIETAMDNIGTTGWSRDYICKGGLLEGTITDPMFWDKLAIYKNIEIEEEDRNNFFTCSC